MADQTTWKCKGRARCPYRTANLGRVCPGCLAKGYKPVTQVSRTQKSGNGGGFIDRLLALGERCPVGITALRVCRFPALCSLDRAW